MKKQIMAAFISAFILVSFTACSEPGGESGSDQSSVIESGSTASSESSSSAEVSSSADGFSSAEIGVSDSKLLIPAEEAAAMLKPIKEYVSWDYKMFPPDGNEEIVDKEQVITAKRSYSDTPISFFKVVKGDIRTEEQFMAKLDSLLSEKAKNAILEAPVRYFEFNNGDLYIAMPGPGGYGGAGYDYFFLDSVEEVDKNTVAVKVTGVFNGTTELFEPYSHSGTAVLVKTEDGYLIDEYDYTAADIILRSRKLVLNW